MKKIIKKGQLTFNIETMEATSYDWWKFLTHVEHVGLVFNDYQMSATTRKHQALVKEKLSFIGIKPTLVLKSKNPLIDRAHIEAAIKDTIKVFKARIEKLEQEKLTGREVKNKARQHEIDTLLVEITVLNAVLKAELLEDTL